MNEKTERYFLYGFMMIVVIVAAWAVSGLFVGGSDEGHNDERYDALMEARATADVTDKCAPPSGTSEEEWKEHMSHHPAQYEGCL